MNVAPLYRWYHYGGQNILWLRIEPSEIKNPAICRAFFFDNNLNSRGNLFQQDKLDINAGSSLWIFSFDTILEKNRS